MFQLPGEVTADLLQRVFTARTPLFFMIGSFLNSFVFMPVNFLLPQFFQGVKGVGTFQSGIDLIPFSICGALFSTIGRCTQLSEKVI